MEEKDYCYLKLNKKECITLMNFLIREIEENKSLFKKEISKDEKEEILNRISAYNVLIGIIQSSMR